MSFEVRATGGTRRRRMMIGSTEEPTAPSAKRRNNASRSTEVPAGRRLYDDRASSYAQPTLTQLIPGRLLHHFFLWAGQLAIALAIVALAAQTVDGRLTKSAWPSLIPSQAASLANWWCSTECLLAAVVCVLIYLVRRHRVDDYRGRYRWWLWGAVAALLSSVDAATDLSRQAVTWIESEIPHVPFTPETWSVAWPLVAAALLGVGLIWELWESRLVRVTVTALALLVATRLLIVLNVIPSLDPAVQELALAGVRLAIPLMVVGTLALYARHITLIANGEAPVLQQTRSSETPNKDATPRAADGVGECVHDEPQSRRRWGWPWRGKTPTLTAATDDEVGTAASEPKRRTAGKQSSQTRQSQEEQGRTRRRRAKQDSPAGAPEADASPSAALTDKRKRKKKNRGSSHDNATDGRPDDEKSRKHNSHGAHAEQELRHEPHEGADANEHEDEYAGLSKSERRRLRKLKRRQRRQQAA